jgi:hypothetical protein
MDTMAEYHGRFFDSYNKKFVKDYLLSVMAVPLSAMTCLYGGFSASYLNPP